MDHPEGARLDRGDRVDFDRRVRMEFRGAQISSDGGLLVTPRNPKRNRGHLPLHLPRVERVIEPASTQKGPRAAP